MEVNGAFKLLLSFRYEGYLLSVDPTSYITIDVYGGFIGVYRAS